MSPCDTEYNDFCGGVINVVTKSGENDFHGLGLLLLQGRQPARHQEQRADDRSGVRGKTYGATFAARSSRTRCSSSLGCDKIERVTPISIGPGEGTAANTFTFQVPGVTQADIDSVTSIASSVWGFDPMGLCQRLLLEENRALVRQA